MTWERARVVTVFLHSYQSFSSGPNWQSTGTCVHMKVTIMINIPVLMLRSQRGWSLDFTPCLGKLWVSDESLYLEVRQGIIQRHPYPTSGLHPAIGCCSYWDCCWIWSKISTRLGTASKGKVVVVSTGCAPVQISPHSRILTHTEYFPCSGFAQHTTQLIMDNIREFYFVNYTPKDMGPTGKVPVRPVACKGCRETKSKVRHS